MDWMHSKSALAQAEMALKELELTCICYEPESALSLRDDIDLKKRAVNQSAGQYIRSHEALQRISIRRQLDAFMQGSGDALAASTGAGNNAPQSSLKSSENGLSTGRQPAFAKRYQSIWPTEEIFIMRRMTGIF